MEVMARLDTMESTLSTEKAEHKADVKRLNLKIDTLTQENQILRDDNARLKSIINNDSSNTSLPPSTDQKSRKSVNTYNSRETSNKKAGGQKGHTGTTLTKADMEAKIRAGNCKHEIKEIGKPISKQYITKYVMDLEVKPLITEIRIYADKHGHYDIPFEYRSDVVYGVNVKAMAVALYSEGVMANDRIASFLNAASDHELNLSQGSVYGFCKKLAKRSTLSIEILENQLLNQKVISSDATTVSVNGKQHFIRNFSIEKTVVYQAMKSKTIEAMRKLPILANFTGTFVHDHETALYHFGSAHAECNIHVIRYLRKNTEDTKNKWSEQMKALLCEANQTRRALISQGVHSFPIDKISAYEKKYWQLIAVGRIENRTTHLKYAKADENRLLNRMEKYSQNHLMFLHDFSVPFDNNMSERDLRKAKNRQKMAGGFRKDSGHEMYCAILTVIETLKRRNMAMLENLRELFRGTPAIF